MNREDLIYLCNTIGNLAGIPLRVFEGDERIYYRSLVDLPKDPMDIFSDQIRSVADHVGYFATPYFDYYGIVNAPPYRLVIGPTRPIESTDSELRAQAFDADVPQQEINAFISAMKNIVRMPLESVLQMLCTVNFVLNGEKLSLADISMFELDSALMHKYSSLSREPSGGSQKEKKTANPDRYDYTGYAVEQKLMDIVANGDSSSLRKWLSSSPAVRPGTLSSDYIRQMKNIFIVSATLASRAAIRGGLDTKTAFYLSDTYIQRCEMLRDPDSITNLQFNMIVDYTDRVERIRSGGNPTVLSKRVANYVLRHLSEQITVEALTEELYISRSRLTARFRAETGKTLTEFIAEIKTEEAKRLLLYSDKSLISISDYLGFSSQSHFTRVFRKHTGTAPGRFREQRNKQSDHV